MKPGKLDRATVTRKYPSVWNTDPALILAHEIIQGGRPDRSVGSFSVKCKTPIILNGLFPCFLHLGGVWYKLHAKKEKEENRPLSGTLMVKFSRSFWHFEVNDSALIHNLSMWLYWHIYDPYVSPIFRVNNFFTTGIQSVDFDREFMVLNLRFPFIRFWVINYLWEYCHLPPNSTKFKCVLWWWWSPIVSLSTLN